MDAVVIGAGPNGLTAAATLARHGWKVLVLEANGRPGGACYSAELTLPGYLHDVGAAFFPFADDSPAFRDLDLAGAGLQLGQRPARELPPRARRLQRRHRPRRRRNRRSLSAKTARPGGGWPLWRRAMGDRLAAALLAPLPGFGPALRLGPYHLAALARAGPRHDGGLRPAAFPDGGGAARRSRSGAARRPGTRRLRRRRPRSGAGPAGGGQRLSRSRRRRPVHHRTPCSVGWKRRAACCGSNAHVERILVRDGRAVAVRTADGDEIAVRPGRAGGRGAAGPVPDSCWRPCTCRGWDAPAYAPFPLRLGHVQDGLGPVRPGALVGGGGPGVGRGPRRRQPRRPAAFTRQVRAGAVAGEPVPGDRPAIARRPEPRAGRRAHACGRTRTCRPRWTAAGRSTAKRSPTASSSGWRGWRRVSAA